MGQDKSNFGLKEFAGIDHDQVHTETGPIEYILLLVNLINHNVERFTFDYA